jgi:hypothetical protein
MFAFAAWKIADGGRLGEELRTVSETKKLQKVSGVGLSSRLLKVVGMRRRREQFPTIGS